MKHSSRDYTLGHKRSLNKVKIIEIIQSKFAYHNEIKLEISNMKKTRNPPTTWISNNTSLNNPLAQKVKEEGILSTLF